MVMKKILPLLIIVACTSQQATVEDTTTTTTTTTTTIKKNTDTTVTTLHVEEIPDVKSLRDRRGVLRISHIQYIPLIRKYDGYYTDTRYYPEHEYVDDFSYFIQYPVFPSDQACFEKINSDILVLIEGFVVDKKSVLEILTPDDVVDFNWNEELDVSYDIVEISDDFISLFIYKYVYSTGQMHGMEYHYGLNYALEDCSTIEPLVDLIDESVENYKRVISNEIELQLCAPLLDPKECFNEATKAYWGTNNDYVLEAILVAKAISSHGIFIQHNRYSASAGAFGAELILLPWYDLGSILDKGGKYSYILENINEDHYFNTAFEPEWDY